MYCTYFVSTVNHFAIIRKIVLVVPYIFKMLPKYCKCNYFSFAYVSVNKKTRGGNIPKIKEKKVHWKNCSKVNELRRSNWTSCFFVFLCQFSYEFIYVKIASFHCIVNRVILWVIAYLALCITVFLQIFLLFHAISNVELGFRYFFI